MARPVPLPFDSAHQCSGSDTRMYDPAPAHRFIRRIERFGSAVDEVLAQKWSAPEECFLRGCHGIRQKDS